MEKLFYQQKITAIFFLIVVSAKSTFSQPTAPSNWWQYPYPYDTVILAGQQAQLQNENLIDSYTENRRPAKLCRDPYLGLFGRAPAKCWKFSNKYRRLDGECNDLENPAAGSLYYRFGRNVPLNATEPNDCDMFTPNPREISRKLLERKEFIPATSINILVAGWIQFQIHDWFDHGENDRTRYIKVPLEEDDPDFSGNTMEVPRTKADSCTKVPGLLKKMCDRLPNNILCYGAKDYETFQNKVTHWWDASQLYGTDRQRNRQIRSMVGGKLTLTENDRLPIDQSTGVPITGNNNNWWVGLGMFHIIWTKEHNYVCDMLKQNNPLWSDGKLFQTARLIISAVIAKIHTLEWTTAILNNPLVKLGLKSNWYGVTLLEFVNGNATLEAALAAQIPELANGIPGSVGNPKNIRGVPYSITQDFVAVYRLHPLMPDTFEIRNHQTDVVENTYEMENTVFGEAEDVFEENSMEDLFYSFGNDHPGAMTLHNYPDFLRNLNLPKSNIHGTGKIDMATIDILRDRERGVPRYNEFRRHLHLTPITSFEDLTTNPTHVEELGEIYDNDVEKIDLLVGSLAESPLPSGFGFSDTFFKIFVLMARRRLEADRFFTDDYTAALYTQWGLDYVDSTWMKDVLIRHYPSLSQPLQDVENVFVPWNTQTVA